MTETALLKAAALLVATVGALWNLRRAEATPNPTMFRLLTVGILSVVALVIVLA